MDKTQLFINNFLAHYSSEYYDPAKAREYYLRTRELKGRQSISGLKTQEKKQAFTYVKKQIGEAKKGERETASEAIKSVVEQAREAATARREEVSEQLSLLLKTLTDNRKSESEKISEMKKREAKKISEEASRKILALPPIPKGISKEQRAELSAKRSEEIANIRGDATNERSALSGKIESEQKALSDESNKDIAKKRETSIAEREKVTSELKATVKNARAEYETLKDNLKSKYENATQQEYDAIKRKV